MRNAGDAEDVSARADDGKCATAAKATAETNVEALTYERSERLPAASAARDG